MFNDNCCSYCHAPKIPLCHPIQKRRIYDTTICSIITSFKFKLLKLILLAHFSAKNNIYQYSTDAITVLSICLHLTCLSHISYVYVNTLLSSSCVCVILSLDNNMCCYWHPGCFTLPPTKLYLFCNNIILYLNNLEIKITYSTFLSVSIYITINLNDVIYFLIKNF